MNKLKSNSVTMVKKKLHGLEEKIVAFVLIILQAVGIYGFLTYWPAVIDLTPLNLLVHVFAILFFGYKYGNHKLILFSIIAWMGGFIIEAIGVNTGWPFGDYTYHEVFGTQFYNTPLLIGFNWVILLLGSGSLINTVFGDKIHIIYKVTIGALLMTLIDFLIEPVAVEFRFWTWEEEQIPLSNYLSWFIISFVLLLIKYAMIPTFKSMIANVILILHLIFFATIFVYIK
jgi:bisanhydrobacterioruberin hydratase